LGVCQKKYSGQLFEAANSLCPPTSSLSPSALLPNFVVATSSSSPALCHCQLFVTASSLSLPAASSDSSAALVAARSLKPPVLYRPPPVRCGQQLHFHLFIAASSSSPPALCHCQLLPPPRALALFVSRSS